MNLLPSFQVNTPTVVHEIFDEEVVVIHLDSGNYYTLDQSGAYIWHLLCQGCHEQVMVSMLAENSQLASAEILVIVEQFLATLRQEQLIVPAIEQPETTLELPPLSPMLTAAQIVSFQAPLIRKYTDMQDLLLLDPIHDVDETGWPHAQRA